MVQQQLDAATFLICNSVYPLVAVTASPLRAPKSASRATNSLSPAELRATPPTPAVALAKTPAAYTATVSTSSTVV